MQYFMQTGKPTHLTQANNGATISAGDVVGFFVNSTTGGTVAMSDGATAISGTITPAAGQFYPFPARLKSGELAVALGGTIDLTVFTN